MWKILSIEKIFFEFIDVTNTEKACALIVTFNVYDIS